MSLRAAFRSFQSRRLRFSKYVGRSALLATALGGGYVVDRQYNASSITRSLRTLYTCAMITLDYKWNFTPEKSDQIPDLHARVAERMYHLFTANGGLYIKIGQAIGANAALLPKPMQEKFASLFDNAPQIPYSEVYKVFVSEFGRPPDGPGGVFAYFDPAAVASASIAQVHRALLHPDPSESPDAPPRWVAVKIQKPAVRTQMAWDLGAYRAVMWAFENWAFDLPVYFAVDFVCDHLKQELDFIREADNAARTAAFVASEPRLRERVHIPYVYTGLSTRRVLTAEWIDGVRLSDIKGVEALGYAPNVMRTMVELFAAQMFDWGWVHCDPHPGNVLVRPHPDVPGQRHRANAKKEPQLVLLDHGLYVSVPPVFRAQWSLLWRALLTGDYAAVERITGEWGFGVPELAASFTLLRPTLLPNNRKKHSANEPPKPRRPLSQYELSVRMKAKLKEFLADTDRMPKVLIFLTRNMRMVQGNNQAFGSPVNRIKITGLWASRSLTRMSPGDSPTSPNSSFSLRSLFSLDTLTTLPRTIISLPHTLAERLHAWRDHLAFLGTLFLLDVLFYRRKAISWVQGASGRLTVLVGLRKGKTIGGTMDFETELENSVRGIARDNFGIEVGEGAFGG